MLYHGNKNLTYRQTDRQRDKKWKIYIRYVFQRRTGTVLLLKIPMELMSIVLYQQLLCNIVKMANKIIQILNNKHLYKTQ